MPDPATDHRVRVFFYGLFMDETLLREDGLHPQVEGVAFVDDYRLVIGRRATLVPSSGDRVYGVVMSMGSAELETLYSKDGLDGYEPVRLETTVIDDGEYETVAYLCSADDAGATNVDYARQLQALARKLGLPRSYVDRLPT